MFIVTIGNVVLYKNTHKMFILLKLITLNVKSKSFRLNVKLLLTFKMIIGKPVYFKATTTTKK